MKKIIKTRKNNLPKKLNKQDLEVDKLKKEIEEYKWSIKKYKSGFDTIYKELEKSEKRFRRLFESSQDAILILDYNTGEIENSNLFIEDILGYNKKELLGKRLWEISEFKNVASNKRKFIELKKKDYIRYEHIPLKNKNGKIIQVEFVSNVYLVSGRKVIQCNIRDISKRYKEQELISKHKQILEQEIIKRTKELKTSETKYKELFESSRDAIMTLSPPNWKFTSGNKSTIRMFAAKNEKDFIKKGPWDISPKKQPDGQLSSEKSKKMIEKAMKGGSHYFEWTHKKINGKNFPATVLLTKVKYNGYEFLQATVRDITPLKKHQEQLNKKIQELERFSKIAIGRELKMIQLKNKIKQLGKKETRKKN
jgi:PAS domain S-box-containing protein